MFYHQSVLMILKTVSQCSRPSGLIRPRRSHARIDIDLALHKTVRPTTHIQWLGYIIDTNLMQLSMPPLRMKEVLAEIDTWYGKKTASKGENPAALWQIALARILAILRTSNHTGYTTIGEDYKKDIRSFSHHGLQSNGVVFVPDGPRPMWELERDLCMEGGGGYSQTHCYKVRYPPTPTSSRASTSINSRQKTL